MSLSNLHLNILRSFDIPYQVPTSIMQCCIILWHVQRWAWLWWRPISYNK